MTKKRDSEEFKRIDAAYDAFYNELASMPIEDVRRALAEAGIDRALLRERLHARANEIARAHRASGHAASHVLTRLLDQTSSASTLPADPKRASDKARQYVRNLFAGGLSGPQAQVVGAFRGQGDLTDRDKETIDEIDAELRARAEAENADEPSKD